MLELGQIQAKLLGIILERCTIECTLVLEQFVMHFPEFALFVCRHRRCGCLTGILVEGQRLVLEGDCAAAVAERAAPAGAVASSGPVGAPAASVALELRAIRARLNAALEA